MQRETNMSVSLLGAELTGWSLIYSSGNYLAKDEHICNSRKCLEPWLILVEVNVCIKTLEGDMSLYMTVEVK